MQGSKQSKLFLSLPVSLIQDEQDVWLRSGRFSCVPEGHRRSADWLDKSVPLHCRRYTFALYHRQPWKRLWSRQEVALVITESFGEAWQHPSNNPLRPKHWRNVTLHLGTVEKYCFSDRRAAWHLSSAHWCTLWCTFMSKWLAHKGTWVSHLLWYPNPAESF